MPVAKNKKNYKKTWYDYIEHLRLLLHDLEDDEKRRVLRKAIIDLKNTVDHIADKIYKPKNDTTTHFEVSKKYQCSSPGDSNCIWTFEVTKRTEKNVWIMQVDKRRDDVPYWKKSWKKSKRKKIHHIEQKNIKCEAVYPLGKYSLCPFLTSHDRNKVK